MEETVKRRWMSMKGCCRRTPSLVNRRGVQLPLFISCLAEMVLYLRECCRIKGQIKLLLLIPTVT